MEKSGITGFVQGTLKEFVSCKFLLSYVNYSIKIKFLISNTDINFISLLRKKNIDDSYFQ